MRRRRYSTGETLALVMYWMSGIAFLVEPFRWWAKASRKRAHREAVGASAALVQQQTRLTQEQAAAVAERRWRDWEDHQRQLAASRPLVCRYCKRSNPPGSRECHNCGAHS